jgi:hypothetical protein
MTNISIDSTQAADNLFDALGEQDPRPSIGNVQCVRLTGLSQAGSSAETFGFRTRRSAVQLPSAAIR